jgi:protein-disulfide isomerase
MRLISSILCSALLALGIVVAAVAQGQVNSDQPEKCLGGKFDAPIRLDVFSDFECSHCRGFFLDTIPMILNEYCDRNKVCVVYHEFPLSSNMYSRQAAQYSLASQKLGRAPWRAVMTALYQDQGKWAPTGKMDEVVARVLTPADYSRLKRILLDPSLDSEIESEIALGEKKGVTGTPTVFIRYIGREQKVFGSLPYPILKDFFDSIVK